MEIRGQLVRPVSLCHSGEGLYQDGDRVYEKGDSSLGLEVETFQERVRAIEGVKWPRVAVRIDKGRYNYMIARCLRCHMKSKRLQLAK